MHTKWSFHNTVSTFVKPILTGPMKLAELSGRNTLSIHLAVFAIKVNFAAIQPSYAVKYTKRGKVPWGYGTCSLIYTRTCTVSGHNTSTETPNKCIGRPSEFYIDPALLLVLNVPSTF